jgi:hypothetical protein
MAMPGRDHRDAGVDQKPIPVHVLDDRSLPDAATSG